MTETKTPEQMLGRIRALLAKAEDPAATTAESEAYTAKATELMARYGIDRAMLADANPSLDIPGDRIIVITGAYAIDKQHLCSQIAMALGCKTILRKRFVGGAKQLSVHLFGYGSDLGRAEMLFTSLLLQAVNGMLRGRPEYGETVAAFRRSWLQGFTSAVASRILRAERDAQRAAETRRTQQDQSGESGRSVALVLADRASVVNARVQAAYPKLGKARPRELSGSGFYEGQDAGRRANIGDRSEVAEPMRGALGGVA